MHVAQIGIPRRSGVTNFIKIHDLIHSYGCQQSIHTAPTLPRSLGIGLLGIRSIKYFSDHAAIEQKALDCFLPAASGGVLFLCDPPGLGISLKKKISKCFQYIGLKEAMGDSLDLLSSVPFIGVFIY